MYTLLGALALSFGCYACRNGCSVYVGYFGEYIADFLQPSSPYSDDIETTIDQLLASDFHLTPRLALRGRG